MFEYDCNNMVVLTDSKIVYNTVVVDCILDKIDTKMMLG